MSISRMLGFTLRSTTLWPAALTLLISHPWHCRSFNNSIILFVNVRDTKDKMSSRSAVTWSGLHCNPVHQRPYRRRGPSSVSSLQLRRVVASNADGCSVEDDDIGVSSALRSAASWSAALTPLASYSPWCYSPWRVQRHSHSVDVRRGVEDKDVGVLGIDFHTVVHMATLYATPTPLVTCSVASRPSSLCVRIVVLDVDISAMCGYNDVNVCPRRRVPRRYILRRQRALGGHGAWRRVALDIYATHRFPRRRRHRRPRSGCP